MALPPAWTPPQGFGLTARFAPLPRAQRAVGGESLGGWKGRGEVPKPGARTNPNRSVKS